MPRKIEDGNRVHSARGDQAIRSLAESWEAGLRALPLTDAPLALICDDDLAAVAAAAWLVRSARPGIIIPRSRMGAAVQARVEEAGYALIDIAGGPGSSATPTGARPSPPPAVTAPASTSASTSASASAPAPASSAGTGAGSSPGSEPGTIGLLTSGSTGVPKIIRHTWDSLFTLNRSRDLEPNHWLVTYLPGTYAWYQVVTLALFAPGQDLVVASDRDPHSLLDAASAHQATAVSSTPTFWRFLLLQTAEDSLRRLPFRQITLGGERVDQALLDQIRSVQPAARISHIYASTEVGAAIVVHDGREGFPRAWLEEPEAERPGGPEGCGVRPTGKSEGAARPRLRIQGGTLFVKSRFAAPEFRGWVDTGDAVEIHGDRVIITGRRDSSIVNIGGVKVSTYSVERLLLDHPRVQWCRVYGRPAPLLGHLLAADVVPRGEVKGAPDLEAELTRTLLESLPEPAVPRFWRFLETIPATGGFKAELT